MIGLILRTWLIVALIVGMVIAGGELYEIAYRLRSPEKRDDINKPYREKRECAKDRTGCKDLRGGDRRREAPKGGRGLFLNRIPSTDREPIGFGTQGGFSHKFHSQIFGSHTQSTTGDPPISLDLRLYPTKPLLDSSTYYKGPTLRDLLHIASSPTPLGGLSYKAPPIKKGSHPQSTTGDPPIILGSPFLSYVRTSSSLMYGASPYVRTSTMPLYTKTIQLYTPTIQNDPSAIQSYSQLLAVISSYYQKYALASSYTQKYAYIANRLWNPYCHYKYNRAACPWIQLIAIGPTGGSFL